MGVECRNMGMLSVIDILTYHPGLEVAAALVSVTHSEITDIFKGEYTTISWRCTQREFDTFAAGYRSPGRLQVGLRDDEYAKFPVAVNELLAGEKITRGEANFLQAAVDAIERYRDKHFPQGVNTQAKRGYRRKPSPPDPFNNPHGICIHIELTEEPSPYEQGY